MHNYFKILRCTKCGAEINTVVTNCSTCGSFINFANDKIYFTRFDSHHANNLFFKIKHYIKYNTIAYDCLVNIIGPVFSLPLTLSLRKFLREYRTSKGQIVVNLGSGNTKLLDDIINIDLIDYKNVNIVSDITNLPFRDNSIDLLINIAVLEHIKNPEQVVMEIERVLKPGGMVYSYIPFLQPFHASPFDYNRFTSEGIKYLYRNFELISVKPTAGPMSALLWIFQEWLALLFSFGIKPLYYLLFIIFMVLTFPFKLIDIILIYHPLSENIASGFSIIVRKN